MFPRYEFSKQPSITWTFQFQFWDTFQILYNNCISFQSQMKFQKFCLKRTRIIFLVQYILSLSFLWWMLKYFRECISVELWFFAKITHPNRSTRLIFLSSHRPRGNRCDSLFLLKCPAECHCFPSTKTAMNKILFFANQWIKN